MEKEQKIRLAIFASGTGTNAEAIIHRSLRIDSAFTVACVISNRKDAEVLKKAALFNIPAIYCNPDAYEDQSQYVDDLLATLRHHQVDLIALAGYLRKIPSAVIEQYKGRIFNIHPALLPKYGGKGMYGRRVHEAVLQAGESESGVTIHEVTEEYDAGPILLQQKVRIDQNETPETLEKKIKQIEHRTYPEFLQQIAQKMKGAQ